VTRINTYTTAPTVWTQEAIDLARTIDIVTFASPSAVHNWVQQVGNDAIAVVIGPTSAEAARTAGFKSVHAPSVGSKGLAPWAELIRKLALQEG
jgi:uroporphyrinogen-III synthase